MLCRNSTSPPKALTIHTSVSLPPVGSNSPIRWEIEGAKQDAAGPSSSAERPLGQLSMPSSPRQLDTPTLGRSHVPASPFASAAHADHAHEGAGVLGIPSPRPTYTWQYSCVHACPICVAVSQLCEGVSVKLHAQSAKERLVCIAA